MPKRIENPPPLPPRPVDGHKGLFGRVLVVGGNEEMIGAPVLTGTAALRMGSGLVQIAVPRSILAAALSITPELIGFGLTPRLAGELARRAAPGADAIILGPGLGQNAQAKKLVQQLIRIDKPMVIDADALNILANGKSFPKTFKAQAVLTPHPGEMKRLAQLFDRNDVPTDDEGRIDMAIHVARAFRQIIVLKGHRTVITDGDRVYLNQTGDSSLSKAGSGDVLSGIIGSLLGQKMDRFDAACVGTFLHGKAGELAGKRLGRRCVLARDVIDALPQAIAEYESGTR